MRQLGPGCTNSGRQWCVPTGTAWPAPVEVDEAWVSGQDPDSPSGRHTNSQAIVAVAAKERGRRSRWIRLKRIYAADGANLLTFIEEVVTPASVVNTDAWPSYAGLANRGYDHKKIVLRVDPRVPPASCCAGLTWWSPC